MAHRSCTSDINRLFLQVTSHFMNDLVSLDSTFSVFNPVCIIKMLIKKNQTKPKQQPNTYFISGTQSLGN